jgi:F-type H+-transporting ATPase subunit a
MRRFSLRGLVMLLALGFLPSVGQGQETPAPLEAAHAAQAEPAGAERAAPILEHLADKSEIDYPCFNSSYICTAELPHWKPVKIGPLLIDFSPTKHLVFMVLAAIVVMLIFVLSGISIQRAQRQGRPPRGFPGAMEAMALYLRDEVILPNVGPHGEGYVPYLLTTFFFILACNMFGLFPWGSTATGNIAVTGGLAVLAFIVIEVSGMRTLGFAGYMHTIFYLPDGLPTFMKPVILVIMTPIELIGKLAKPFALAVRLFANMTAGHALVLALIGLVFTFQSYLVGVAASSMAVAIQVLELFVAFLQAFVFTLLTAVFIGLMRAEH